MFLTLSMIFIGCLYIILGRVRIMCWNFLSNFIPKYHCATLKRTSYSESQSKITIGISFKATSKLISDFWYIFHSCVTYLSSFCSFFLPFNPRSKKKKEVSAWLVPLFVFGILVCYYTKGDDQLLTTCTNLDETCYWFLKFPF